MSPSKRKTYILKLYVAGNTPNSMRALQTLREILDNESRGVYALKVIDVLKNPQLAEEDKIYTPDNLGLTPEHNETKEEPDKTKSIIRELRNLKLAQFEIMQKETELLKILENQNNYSNIEENNNIEIILK